MFSRYVNKRLSPSTNTRRIKLLIIDESRREVIARENDVETCYSFDTPEAFEALSRVWVRSGWETKYPYTFTWFGRPVIQLPEDLLRVQEAIYRVKPDILIETGVAHGGSLMFYASLFEAMHRGRVIGIDVEIRRHNRAAIEAHELFHRIDLIEGSSIDPEIVERVRSKILTGAVVMVLLDSNHARAHVLAELEQYAPLVSSGSYIVAADGVMRDLVGSPRSGDDWSYNNPACAAQDFLSLHPEFILETPDWPFNESALKRSAVTHWPDAWLRRVG